jgi:hypothetical protein
MGVLKALALFLSADVRNTSLSLVSACDQSRNVVGRMVDFPWMGEYVHGCACTPTSPSSYALRLCKITYIVLGSLKPLSFSEVRRRAGGPGLTGSISASPDSSVPPISVPSMSRMFVLCSDCSTVLHHGAGPLTP